MIKFQHVWDTVKPTKKLTNLGKREEKKGMRRSIGLNDWSTKAIAQVATYLILILTSHSKLYVYEFLIAIGSIVAAATFLKC